MLWAPSGTGSCTPLNCCAPDCLSALSALFLLKGLGSPPSSYMLILSNFPKCPQCSFLTHFRLHENVGGWALKGIYLCGLSSRVLTDYPENLGSTLYQKMCSKLQKQKTEQWFPGAGDRGRTQLQTAAWRHMGDVEAVLCLDCGSGYRTKGICLVAPVSI